MKIDDFILQMQELLKGSSFAKRTWIVGGVPRDLQLGKTDFRDFDLCIEQRYGASKLAEYLNRRHPPLSYEIFPRFATAKLVYESFSLDLAQSRVELYESGRRYPKTRFARVDKDYLRRDFTINSLYLNLFTKELKDPSGSALKHIQEGKIQTIRAPEEVFLEDSLRILRGIRFATTLGFEIEENTAEAMKKLSFTCLKLSSKNLKYELEQIANHPQKERGKKLLSDFSLSELLKFL
ncbi:MAG: hypothetical protein LHW60_00660 [Candidatus Cloacimonetes bacterium]|nr:hypothetical protein [Candidatus Cloacimonadota bacterium]NLO44172.1 CCA tRNA nucleotidyltransferase [Candidatus Cloacimonadota bacterium]